jgi:hypothetical protein
MNGIVLSELAQLFRISVIRQRGALLSFAKQLFELVPLGPIFGAVASLRSQRNSVASLLRPSVTPSAHRKSR